MANILIFGDSISYGKGDIEGGWVQKIRKLKDKESIVNFPNFTLKIYNFSISGDTTEDILNRFNAGIKAYLKDKKAHAIIFSIGLNDSRKINGKCEVSPEKFRKNITELIKRAKKTPSLLFLLVLRQSILIFSNGLKEKLIILKIFKNIKR